MAAEARHLLAQQLVAHALAAIGEPLHTRLEVGRWRFLGSDHHLDDAHSPLHATITADHQRRLAALELRPQVGDSLGLLLCLTPSGGVQAASGEPRL